MFMARFSPVLEALMPERIAEGDEMFCRRSMASLAASPKDAAAKGVKFGRKPKLSEYQRKEALKRRASGETLAEIAKSYAVDISMISRLR
jgi:hypothetical protein